MTYKCLLYTVQDRIATLTLNRPERLNALGDTLREDLYDAVMKSVADPNVGVLVITGAGRGFCSGGNDDTPRCLRKTLVRVMRRRQRGHLHILRITQQSWQGFR